MRGRPEKQVRVIPPRGRTRSADILCGQGGTGGRESGRHGSGFSAPSVARPSEKLRERIDEVFDGLHRLVHHRLFLDIQRELDDLFHAARAQDGGYSDEVALHAELAV